MRLDGAGFEHLLRCLALAWESPDPQAGVACFTEDALHMEPPDVQIYLGHLQLARYFGALSPGTYLRFQNVWFDQARQVGAAEYSFGREGRATADHGVAVVELRAGRIAFWREYFRKGPAAFEEFISPRGKTWQWHIGNHP